MKNYGVDLEREKQDREGRDYVFGSGEDIKGMTDNVAGLVTAGFAWPMPINGIYPRTENVINHCFIFFNQLLARFYPKGEKQFGRDDFMDCVARGFHNEFEKQINYAIEMKFLSTETIKWLHDKNYIDSDKKFVINDAFLAILSGTTRNGNSLKRVVDTFINVGCIPKYMLPVSNDMTWDQYHNTNRITEDMKMLGLEFLEKIKINYQIVYPADYGKFSGKIKWEIFDNYIDRTDGDWIKRLAENYNFLGYSYRVIINEKVIAPKFAIKQNCLYQLIEGQGGFALGLDGKLVIDKTDLIIATWLQRNTKEVINYKGEKELVLIPNTGQLTLEQWNSVDHINLKREPIQTIKSQTNWLYKILSNLFKK